MIAFELLIIDTELVNGGEWGLPNNREESLAKKVFMSTCRL